MNRKEFIKGIGLVAGAAIAVRAKAVGDTPCNRGSTGGAACSLPNRVLGSGRAAMSVSTLGFGILQFNAVVEGNVHARHLYERLGFSQLGTIPRGFRMKDGTFANICPYYRETNVESKQ